MEPADHDVALRHLAAAEDAIARARERIVRQRRIIDSLERRGQHCPDAYALLASLEAACANRERSLAILLKHLARRGWTIGGPLMP